MDTFRAVTGRLDWPVRFTWWVVFLVVANIAAFGALLAPKAHADHSFQSGTCYVTPEMCQNGYNGGLFYFRVDEFWASPSSIKANAQIGLHAAMSAWSSVAGPQLFRTSTDSNTPANYIFAQEFPAYQPTDPNIVSQLYSNAAITLNHGWWGSSYQYYGICYTNACLVDYSEIYVNSAWGSSCGGGSGLSAGIYQYIYAHESGHVLGLDDHGSGALLMNNYWPTGCNSQAFGTYGVNGATTTDIGNPTCVTPKGVRCIYQY